MQLSAGAEVEAYSMLVRVECSFLLVQRWKLMVIKQQLQSKQMQCRDNSLFLKLFMPSGSVQSVLPNWFDTFFL